MERSTSVSIGMDMGIETTQASRSPHSTAEGLAFPTTSSPKRGTAVSDKDRSVIHAAIVAGNWPVVEHYLFTKRVGLDERAPIYRAIVHDQSSDAVRLFKRLLQHDLRLEQVLENQAKAALQSQLDATLDGAIKHGNAALVKVFLGDDDEFNRLVQFDVADATRFRSGSLLNKAVVLSGHISYFRERVEKSLKGAEGFNREMAAIRMAGQHGRLDMIDLILGRLNSFRVNTNIFRAEAFKSAAAHGQLKVVNSLLQKPLAETVMREGLNAAASNNRAEVAQALAKHVTSDLSYDAIRSACYNGHIELARNLSAQAHIPQTTLDNALIACAERSDTTGVAELLRSGANASYFHSCALRTAIDQHHEPIVRLLLTAGADTSQVPHDVLFALDAKHQREIVKLILTSFLQSKRPLDYMVCDAAARKSIGVITRAIEGGLDVRNHGDPLLAAALNQREVDLVRAIIRQGVQLHEYIARLGQSSQQGINGQVIGLAHILLDCSHVSEHLNDTSDTFSKSLLSELGRLRLPDQTAPHGAPDAYEVFSRAHVRESVTLVSPNLKATEVNERVAIELDNLRATTPEKKQLLNRARDLKNQLRRGPHLGIQDMVGQIADSLVLGREQVLATNASAWTQRHVDRRRAEAFNVVCRHLLDEFNLPLISRFLTIWRLPTHQLPQEARPMLSFGSRWTPMNREPYAATNRYVVRCLEDVASLAYAGTTLNNCIGGYTVSCFHGECRVFTVADPNGTIVAALELLRDGSGDIVLPDRSSWRERQFSGYSNGSASSNAWQAKREFVRALQQGQIPTNAIPYHPPSQPPPNARPIELITGIPIGGSDKLIRDHFLKFSIPARHGEPEYRLVQPQTELYLLCQ